MKTIKIKSLSLLNFKGIRKLTIKDFDRETNIYGDNGTGKTTIFDSFIWLLFDKDSTDRKSFEIKTLDSKNNVIKKIDHQVTAVISINDETITLSKIYREKWVKKKGSLEPSFTGHETSYEWNGVPMTAKEYGIKISSIVDESVFKLITNPAAFNSLKWQDQRDVLIGLAGNISDKDIAKGNSDFETLINKLGSVSLDEYKKQIKANILKAKKELETIPTRIDEVERNKPESIDFDFLKDEVYVIDKQLSEVDNQINDRQAQQQSILDKRAELKRQAQKFEFQIGDIKYSLEEKARLETRKSASGESKLQEELVEKKDTLQKSSRILSKYKVEVEELKNENDRYDTKMQELRSEWNEVNSKVFVFNDQECACPTCKRAFEKSEIDTKKSEMELNFNKKKSSDLKAISEKGTYYSTLFKENASLIESKEIRISEIEEGIDRLNQEIDAIKLEVQKELSSIKVVSYSDLLSELIESDTEIPKLKEKIENINKQLENDEVTIDIDDLKAKKIELQNSLNHKNKLLQNESLIESANIRINELSIEEREKAQAIADMERDQFTIEAFEKERSNRIESSVNDQFDIVDFKLFEQQINGGETPTCKALINGVPFSDANTASRINAGLDIINTLSKYYQVNAPVFIDNRESVVKLIYSPSQIVNLIVSEPDKKLRVA